MASVDDYDDETVQKAYYVAEHIYRYGLKPVGYMASTKRYAENHGASTVARHIERRLNSR